MAAEHGLGTSERHLTGIGRSGRLAGPCIPRLKRSHGESAFQPAMPSSPCQACGACCSYSSNWPRFTTEDDAALDLIPEKFVNDRLSGMRCDGDRCSALSGKIGVATACGIYAVRPEVCRTCMPGDPECDMARKRHGLPALGSH